MALLGLTIKWFSLRGDAAPGDTGQYLKMFAYYNVRTY